jgi:hypothetical protein
MSKIEDVTEWFKTRVLTENHIKSLDIGAQTGAKVSGGIPLIGTLFAKVTAAFQGGSEYRKEIRHTIDRHPNELVRITRLFRQPRKNNERAATGGPIPHQQGVSFSAGTV